MEPRNFISDNISWLRLWLFNNKEVVKEDLQHFLFPYSQMVIDVDAYLFREVIPDILVMAVFSEKCRYVHDPTGEEVILMSGFFQQTGRLPTPEDNVVFHYNNRPKTHNFIYYHDKGDYPWFETKCELYIPFLHEKG